MLLIRLSQRVSLPQYLLKIARALCLEQWSNHVKAGTHLGGRVLDTNSQPFNGRVQGQCHKEPQGASHRLDAGLCVTGVAYAGISVLNAGVITSGCAVRVILVMNADQ